VRFARNSTGFSPTGKSLISLSIPFRKNIPLSTQRKSVAYALRPVPLGGVRTSRTLVRDAVDADVLATNSTEADGEVVWS
jgi:hypothetical protein